MANPQASTPKGGTWSPGGSGPKFLGVLTVLIVISLLGYSFFSKGEKASAAEASKPGHGGTTTPQPTTISIEHSNVQINQYYGDVENGSEFNVGTGDTTTTAGGTVNKAQQKPPVASLPPKVNPQAPDSASIHRRKTLERAGRSPNDSAIIEPRSVAQHPGTNGANREQRDSALAQLKLIVRQLERCGANMERMWRDEDTIKCDVRALKQIVKNFTDSLRVYRAYQTQEVHQQAAGNTVIVGLNEPMRAPSYRQRTSVN